MCSGHAYRHILVNPFLGHIVPKSISALASGVGCQSTDIHAAIQFFPEVCIAPSVREGLQRLILLGGLGKMRPNTVMFGWKYNWRENKHVCAGYRASADVVQRGQLHGKSVRLW
jgi:hypothetical protein